MLRFSDKVHLLYEAIPSRLGDTAFGLLHRHRESSKRKKLRNMFKMKKIS